VIVNKFKVDAHDELITTEWTGRLAKDGNLYTYRTI